MIPIPEDLNQPSHTYTGGPLGEVLLREGVGLIELRFTSPPRITSVFMPTRVRSNAPVAPPGAVTPSRRWTALAESSASSMRLCLA